MQSLLVCDRHHIGSCKDCAVGTGWFMSLTRGWWALELRVPQHPEVRQVHPIVPHFFDRLAQRGKGRSVAVRRQITGQN